MTDQSLVSDDCRFDPVAWDAGDPGRGQRWRATALAVASTIGLALYFLWLLRPGRIGNPVLFGVLLTAELFNVVQALGFWWTCLARRQQPRGQWSVAPGAEPPGEATPCDGVFVSSAELAEQTKREPDRSERVIDPLNRLGVVDVDVFIPTYSEPADVVEATIAAAAKLRGARVHVALLDDGNRDEMAQLARRYGVGYVRRTLHVGAKAGNINHALGRTRSPFVLVLDCDHVPHPDMLARTLPEFVDEAVAFVQTPQYYANAPYNRVAAASWRQQALFFGPIARGKDSHASMFCCGTNVIFRREALVAVGGFPTGSLTEDFALSIDLHERGWSSAYVPEVLASGLGPEDMASYVGQQHRWARGCLGMIPRVLSSTLPFTKKLQYLLSASYFLSGWTVLVYLSMPVVRILTGAQPLAGAAADSFLAAFGPYFVLSLATVASVGGGYYTFSAYSLAASTFWIHIDATYRVVAKRTGSFVVTPKVGDSGRQFRPAIPTIFAIAVLVGAALYGLAHGQDAATLNNVAFAALHVSILGHGIAAAVAPRWSAATAPVDVRPAERAAVDVA